MLRTLREFLHARDITEVQTPTLGAATVTDPDVESIPVPGHGYLQTSPEYFLKRLLAAGVPDCYQLGPVFRADEQGRRHNPEFTMLEWYRLGFDHHALMAEVAALVDAVLGEAPWRTLTYASLVGDLSAPRDELDLSFAQSCEALRGRCFIVDYPADQAALARELPTGNAARFEVVVDGLELANGYWELLDADTHRARFARDNEIRKARGLPSRDIDESFLAALDAGLPACAGVSVGVDRLLMLQLGLDDISEVLGFRR